MLKNGVYRMISNESFLRILENKNFYCSIQNFTKYLSDYRNTNTNINDLINENNYFLKNNLNYHFLVNKQDIIGFCKTEETNQNNIYLYSYLINPYYRGLGYNNIFMNNICSNLKNMDYNKIELKVHQDNIKAINTYINNDYHTIDKINSRYIMNKILK
jgi:ribosomal protein S18 acetylase RimI-like enzyme